nr:hypothetical protein 2 [bacterium]
MTENYNEYKSWEEIDIALKFLAEKKLELKKLETERDEEINKVKDKNAFKIDILQQSIANSEECIKRFTENHLGDFGDKRSKKFTFGKISLKSSKSVVFGCIETTVKKLKELKLNDCVRQKEEIVKDALKKLDKATLQKIGVSILTEDKISIEAG